MQCRCLMHSLPIQHICLQCEYLLICQICLQKEHETHKKVDLQQVLALIGTKESDQKLVFNPIQPNNKLFKCDQTFQRVGQLIDQINQEIHQSYDRIAILLENNNKEIQNEFSQICKQLQLKQSFIYQKGVQFCLLETLNVVKEVVIRFHSEIIEDINIIFRKFTDFEELVDTQIKTINQLLTQNRLKKEIQKPEQNPQSVEKAAIQFEQQDEILTSKQQQVNNQSDAKSICVICKGPNAGKKCTECESCFHLFCAKKEISQVIIDEQEQKITCLKHVDKFYLRKVKMEIGNWDIDQLENKSIDLEDYDDQPKENQDSQQQVDLEFNDQQEQFYEEEQNELYSDPDRKYNYPEQFSQAPQEIPQQISFYRVSNHSTRWRGIGSKSKSQSRITQRSNQKRGRGRQIQGQRGTGRPRGRPRGSISKKMVLEDDDN